MEAVTVSIVTPSFKYISAPVSRLITPLKRAQDLNSLIFNLFVCILDSDLTEEEELNPFWDKSNTEDS